MMIMMSMPHHPTREHLWHYTLLPAIPHIFLLSVVLLSAHVLQSSLLHRLLPSRSICLQHWHPNTLPYLSTTLLWPVHCRFKATSTSLQCPTLTSPIPSPATLLSQSIRDSFSSSKMLTVWSSTLFTLDKFTTSSKITLCWRWRLFIRMSLFRVQAAGPSPIVRSTCPLWPASCLGGIALSTTSGIAVFRPLCSVSAHPAARSLCWSALTCPCVFHTLGLSVSSQCSIGPSGSTRFYTFLPFITDTFCFFFLSCLSLLSFLDLVFPWLRVSFSIVLLLLIFILDSPMPTLARSEFLMLVVSLSHIFTYDHTHLPHLFQLALSQLILLTL